MAKYVVLNFDPVIDDVPVDAVRVFASAEEAITAARPDREHGHGVYLCSLTPVGYFPPKAAT